MMSTQTAAVVVMYRPEKKFVQNVSTYLDRVARLYLIDNSESPDLNFYNAYVADPKVEIIADKVNHGIAKAFNIAAEKAKRAGYKWLLTMDQDSYFENETLANYFEAAAQYPEQQIVAVFGLPYDKDFLTARSNQGPYIEVNSLISSGSLVNLHAYGKTGGFDEKLFIDEVDHDYCYRSIINGFKVVCIKAGLMNHSLGTALELRAANGSAPGKKTLHSPQRIYYMVRNGLYIAKTYKRSFTKEAAKRRKIINVTLKNNILYGNDKPAVIKYAMLGYLDFIRNRYYKL